MPFTSTDLKPNSCSLVGHRLGFRPIPDSRDIPSLVGNCVHMVEREPSGS